MFRGLLITGLICLILPVFAYTEDRGSQQDNCALFEVTHLPCVERWKTITDPYTGRIREKQKPVLFATRKIKISEHIIRSNSDSLLVFLYEYPRWGGYLWEVIGYIVDYKCETKNELPVSLMRSIPAVEHPLIKNLIRSQLYQGKVFQEAAIIFR